METRVRRWLSWLSPWRLVLLGLALRLLWLLLCDNTPTSDQTVYDQAARALAEGRGFVDEGGRPHAWWPVGYPAALAPFYWLLGATARAGFVANLLFGAALIAGCIKLARELFGEPAGRLAGLLAAVSPTFVLLTTVLASENLFVALAVWGSWALVRAVRRPARAAGYCALGGVLIGLSAYVRAPGLLLAVVFPLLALAERWRLARVAALSALVGALAIAVLLPWGFRTQRHFGTFQIVSMNGGSNLWMGNNPESDGGYMRPPPDVHGLSIPEMETVLRRRAFAFIREHPGRYLLLCARRVGMTLRADTIAAVWNAPGLARWGGAPTVTFFKLICTGFYYATWLALAAGLWWRRRHGGWDRYDLALAGAVVASGFTFVFIVGGGRYHLPMAPYLWVWSAGATSPFFRSAAATG